MSVEPKEEIQSELFKIEAAKNEIERICKQHIPDYHFMSHRCSNFWNCDKSPVGWCVWDMDSAQGRLSNASCHYCGGPVERK